MGRVGRSVPPAPFCYQLSLELFIVFMDIFLSCTILPAAQCSWAPSLYLLSGGERESILPFFALCFFLILGYTSFFCLLCNLCFLQVLFTVMFLLLSFPFLLLRGVWSTPSGLPCEDSSTGSILLESPREELCYFFFPLSSYGGFCPLRGWLSKDRGVGGSASLPFMCLISSCFS